MNILKPNFYNEFHCIGGECPLTCCGGWLVTIDEKTYKTYRKMGGYIAKFAKKNIIYDSECKVYYIRHDPDVKLCPMCDEQQLCTIVKQKGPDALSDLCREFPRESFHTYVVEERYLSCVCPKVVELLCKLDTKITFEKEIDENAKKYDLKMMPEWNSVNLQIREVIVDFIQKDEMPLWFRQFYGMYTLSKVKPAYLSVDFDSVCSQMASYYVKSYRDTVYDVWQKVEVNREKQFQSMRLLVHAAEEQILKVAFSDKYNSMKKILELIDINNKCTFLEWEEARKKWNQDRNPLAEENLFVYDIMECLLPNAQVFPLGFMDEFYLLGNYIVSIFMTTLIHGFQILFRIKNGHDQEMNEIIVSVLNRAFRGGGDPSYTKKNIDDAKAAGILSVGFLRCLLDV